MYDRLSRIALEELGDIVVLAASIGRRSGVPLKLRLDIRDGTFVDMWLSTDQLRYAYHWEQRAKRGLLYRHDNAPDHPEIKTFPKHLHAGSETAVEDSHISDDPARALREFLQFVRQQLAECEP